MTFVYPRSRQIWRGASPRRPPAAVSAPRAAVGSGRSHGSAGHRAGRRAGPRAGRRAGPRAGPRAGRTPGANRRRPGGRAPPGRAAPARPRRARRGAGARPRPRGTPGEGAEGGVQKVLGAIRARWRRQHGRRERDARWGAALGRERRGVRIRRPRVRRGVRRERDAGVGSGQSGHSGHSGHSGQVGPFHGHRALVRLRERAGRRPASLVLKKVLLAHEARVFVERARARLLFRARGGAERLGVHDAPKHRGRALLRERGFVQSSIGLERLQQPRRGDALRHQVQLPAAAALPPLMSP